MSDKNPFPFRLTKDGIILVPVTKGDHEYNERLQNINRIKTKIEAECHVEITYIKTNYPAFIDDNFKEKYNIE